LTQTAAYGIYLLMRHMMTGQKIGHATLYLLAFFTLAFLACPSDQDALPELKAPAWQDGETSIYDIARGDSVLYRSRIVLNLDEEFGTPTAVVTTVVEPAEAQQFFYDSAAVVFRRDSLMPIRSYRFLETDIGVFDIVAAYERGRVTIEKQSIEGVEKQQLKTSLAAWDNEMVPTLLRSIPLASGTEFLMQTAVPIDLRVVRVRVMVLGTKQVTTALGSIMCREVVLIAPAKEIRFWFELAEPHRLVGLHDPETETEMLLASYTPARIDTLVAPGASAVLPSLP
jgi:hypothetical protein